MQEPELPNATSRSPASCRQGSALTRPVHAFLSVFKVGWVICCCLLIVSSVVGVLLTEETPPVWSILLVVVGSLLALPLGILFVAFVRSRIDRQVAGAAAGLDKSLAIFDRVALGLMGIAFLGIGIVWVIIEKPAWHIIPNPTLAWVLARIPGSLFILFGTICLIALIGKNRDKELPRE
jgi:hypothetical protein